jgi:hypothetical protein
MLLFFKKYYLFVAIILLLISCKSPLDIVTPRTKIPIKGSNSLYLLSATFYENGILRQFSMNDNYMIEIDTTKSPIIIWIKTNFYTEIDQSSNNQLLSNFHILIDSLMINVDSLLLDTNRFSIDNKNNPSLWIKYHLLRGYNTTSSDTLEYSEMPNNTEVELIFSKNNKTLTANLKTKVYDYKIWLEEHDTVITDTTFYHLGDSSWFIVNPPKNKQIIEEKRKNDTLLLIGYLIFKYD